MKSEELRYWEGLLTERMNAALDQLYRSGAVAGPRA